MRSDKLAGWISTAVEAVVERHFSGPSPTCEERNVSDPQEWGVLKTTAITWHGWNPLAHKVLPSRYWGQEHLTVREGDVVITKAGPRHRCGVVAHVTSIPANIIVSGKMIGLRPNKDLVVPKVLAAALTTAEVQKYLDLRTTGMAESQVNFTNDDLLATPILLPPLPEQRRIAEILDTADEAIRQSEQVIAKLKAVKAGLLHDLLTRGLDERGRLRDPQAHPERFKDSPLGRIPREWEAPILAEHLAHIEQGWSPNCEDLPASNGEWGVLKTTSVVWSGYDTTANKRLPKGLQPRPPLEVHPSDVLMTRAGPNSRVGVVAFVSQTQPKLMLSDKLYRLTPRPSLQARFLGLALSDSIYQSQLSKMKTGMAESQTNISQEIVRALRIPLPPEGEQRAIAAVLDGHVTRICAEEAALEKLHQVKRGLMDDLLTGRVRVQT